MNKDIHFMDYRYPSVNELRERSKKKVPKFAFEYLDGGCHDDVNLKRNTQRIRDIELKPKYLIEQNDKALNLKTFLSCKFSGLKENLVKPTPMADPLHALRFRIGVFTLTNVENSD